MRTFPIMLSVLLFFGCSYNQSTSSKEMNEDVNLKFDIDGEGLQHQNINISYVLNGKTDSIISENDKISLPLFDSLISTFEVSWNDYSLSLSGDFLQYELPNILAKDVDTWYLKVDNPPFENQNVPENSNIKYIFMIHVDSTRLTGIWVNHQ